MHTMRRILRFSLLATLYIIPRKNSRRTASRKGSLFFRRLQAAVEEIACSVVCGQPIAVQKKVVDFVRKNELLNLGAFLAKTSSKVNGLREIDVAVLVAVNEKHRGFPYSRR